MVMPPKINVPVASYTKCVNFKGTFPSHTTLMWCYIFYISQPLMLGMYRWFLISKTEVWRQCI